MIYDRYGEIQGIHDTTVAAEYGRRPRWDIQRSIDPYITLAKQAPKKSEIVVLPGRIWPCKQNKSAIFSTYSHASDGKIKPVALSGVS